MKSLKWFSTPQTSDAIQQRNFRNVQIDAIGVGLANAVAPFVSVFLARLGASNIQIGLLTTMPAIAGFIFSIPFGRYLQKQANIVRWFSFARLSVIMSYAMIGIASFVVPQKHLITVILMLLALITIPQTILSITFSVVMNAVAGPDGRFELMSRRWSILGITTSLTTILLGQVLDLIKFPSNYQVAFIGLSMGGMISYYFSSRIDLSKSKSFDADKRISSREGWKQYLSMILSEKPFIQFVSKRLVYMAGISLAVPLFPIYFVRGINLTDSWIANIATAQTFILLFGYTFWVYQSRAKGARKVLLWSTAGLSLYPILTSFTRSPILILLYAGMAGIFSAGLNLVFFDELMKTVPIQYSANFVSFSQTLEYMPSILAPLIGSFLADHVGISFALALSGCVRFIGFLLFFLQKFPKKVMNISSSEG